MSNYLVVGGTLGFTADSVPDHIVLTPSTATVIPGATRPFTGVILTVGGRDTGLTPTSYTIDDTTNFSIDSVTGVVTGINAGFTATVHAHYDSGSIHLTSNAGTITCSTFNGMSATAASIIDAIGNLPGGTGANLSQRLTMANQLVPNVTNLTTNPVINGVGWYKIENPANQILPVVDVDATYGYTVDMVLPIGVHLPIDNVTRGNHPIVTLTSGTNALDLTSIYYWAGFSNSPPFAIKNWDGDNTTNAFVNTVLGNIVSFGIVDSSHIRLGDHVSNGGSHYCCIAHHVSDATNEPGVGANWTTYWILVPTLAATPIAWASSHEYWFVDSTSWPSDPPVGQALFGIAGGYGTGLVATLPNIGSGSAFGDIWYSYTYSKVNSDYVQNDGGGGQKQVSLLWSDTFGYSSWMVQPGAGIKTAPGDDFGPLIIGTNRWNVDYWNGHDYSGVPQSTPPFFLADATRGVFEKVETILFMPNNGGDLTEEWTVVNGVQVAHLFSRPCMADGVFNDVRLRERSLGLFLENVWGGGGSIPSRNANANKYAEVYLAFGIARSGAQADHFHVYCEEGNTPSHSSPFHIIIELRDANDVKIDCGSSWNDGSSASTKCLFITQTNGTYTNVTGGDVGPPRSSLGLGRRRFEITGASAGSWTFSVSLKQIDNNDTVSPTVHFDGTITLMLT